MKTKIWIIFLISLQGSLYAQVNDSTKLKVKNDSILSKIVKYFPKNWNYTFKGNEFLIDNTDSLWILEENRINANMTSETKEQRINRIKKYGTIGSSKIILRFETKWNDSKRIGAKNSNIAYSKMMTDLDKKYNMSAYYDTINSTKGNPIYTSNTSAGKKIIQQYLDEKDEISKKIITLPNYSTQNYSFFVKSLVGCNDDNHYVFPDESSAQLYQILFVFIELGLK